MYAGVIAYKGGTKAAAAAARAAAAAANRHGDDIVINNVDDDGPGKSALPAKKLNSDGSFGDPKPRFQSSGKVPQPWTCPVAECGRNNFQWRKSCPHCGTKKPQDSVSTSAPTSVKLTDTSTKNDEAKFEAPPAKKPKVTPAPPPDEVAKGNQANANLQGLGTRRGGFGGRGRGRGGASGESMADRLAKMAGMAGGLQTNNQNTSGFGGNKSNTSSVEGNNSNTSGFGGNKPLIEMNFSPFETCNCRDGKSQEEEIKAWQFWHQRQHSVSVIITSSLLRV